AGDPDAGGGADRPGDAVRLAEVDNKGRPKPGGPFFNGAYCRARHEPSRSQKPRQPAPERLPARLLDVGREQVHDPLSRQLDQLVDFEAGGGDGAPDPELDPLSKPQFLGARQSHRENRDTAVHSEMRKALLEGEQRALPETVGSLGEDGDYSSFREALTHLVEEEGIAVTLQVDGYVAADLPHDPPLPAVLDQVLRVGEEM